MKNTVMAPVIQLQLEGPIGPASSDYVARSIEYAAQIRSPLIILRLDTPGGLDLSMREIVKRIIGSPVPVAAYVGPGGARAASAGTYMLYASHLAVMAPATNLGAATPVRIPMPGGADGEDPQPKGKSEDKSTGSVLDRKATNDAVAYIRGLAELRSRNADWAERAVRESVSLPAEEALKLKVIDLMAADSGELLAKLEARSVNVLGQSVTLKLRGAHIEVLLPDWRNRLLAAVAYPTVAYILMLIGIYGLMLEFYHPGSAVPGTLGAICLLLGLYAFQALSINYTGAALIMLGLGLMIAEAFVPSFGILGIGGLSAFVFGSVLLLNPGVEGVAIDPRVIATFTVISVALCLFLTRWLFRVRQRPVVSGREQLIGSLATAVADFSAEGRVRIHGETWTAQAERPVTQGQRVKVKGLDGLTLIVTPLQRDSGE